MTPNTRLLCIDDEEMILELFRMILDKREVRQGHPSGARFQLETFARGDEAIAAVEEGVRTGRPFCGGFFDLKLPVGPSGTETIRKIREIDPRLLCCVVSADPNEVANVEPIFRGRSEDWMYLAKPVGVEEVRRRALQILSEWERRRNEELTQDELTAELQTTQEKLRHAEHLASVGLVAAGAAREIAAPLRAAQTGLSAMAGYVSLIGETLHAYDRLAHEASGIPQLASQVEEVERVVRSSQVHRFRHELAPLIDESLQALDRIAEVASALESMSCGDTEEPGPSDWNACVESALLLVGPRLGPTIRIERRFDPIPSLPFQPGAMSQVFGNLILNAAEAAGDDGVVHVATRFRGGQVIAEIRDEGRGIPPEILPKIFEPFFSYRQKGKPGVGLGLAVAREIVERHGGRIEVDSVPGRGTTVHVVVPARPASAPAAEPRTGVA